MAIKRRFPLNSEDRLLRAVKRLRNAEREMRRAEAANDRAEVRHGEEAVRLNRAGTNYAVARIRLYKVAGLDAP